MSQHKPVRKKLPFAWINDKSDNATRIPFVDFDYELLFNLLDGIVPEDENQADDQPALLEILSPRELQHAYAIAQSILKRSSPQSKAARAVWRDPEKRRRRIAAMVRAAQNPERRQRKAEDMRRHYQQHPEARKKASAITRRCWLDPDYRQRNLEARQATFRQRPARPRPPRASWSDPVSRQKWVAAIRRAAQNPEVQRKKSASLRRNWQNRDRRPMREMMLRLWRERGPELIASMLAVIRTPEYRWGLAKRSRALWADPVFRDKVLSKLRSPETRLRISINSRRYYQEHPEAKVKAAAIARAWWLDPDYRKRNLAARKAAAAKALKQSSPLSHATRASWRDPSVRQRRLESMRRAAKKPEVKQKRAASLRRYWRTHDRQRMRDVMHRLWRKRRPELMAKLALSARRPSFRQRVSENSRARWADPVRRKKAIARLHSPEWRQRASDTTRRYFQEHPEARHQSTVRARALWRDPDFRRRWIYARRWSSASKSRQAIEAREATAHSLAREECARAGDGNRSFLEASSGH